ncbi:DNA polymerase [Kitasatospora purpeofusca]|uniref:DNA polymerase n=1 Tax=Kitasatospora purpeofusca TaxID=67352 RepID=UPI0036A2787F
MLLPQLVTDTDALRRTVEYFKNHGEFVIDVETVGEHRGVPSQNEVVWVSLATRGAAVAIPCGHPNGNQLLRKGGWHLDKETRVRVTMSAVFDPPPPQLRPGQVFEALAPLLFSDRVKIAHNATFDFLTVAKYYDNTYPCGPYGDTIVAAWMLDENRPSLRLKNLVKGQYGLAYDPEDVGRRVENHTFAKVARYALLDARMTWLLWRRLRPMIALENLEPIWQLEMDVLDCLLHMQLPGAPINVEALQALQRDLRQQVTVNESLVYRAAGRVLNLASTPQKQKMLYGKPPEGLGLAPRVFTKTGAPSTAAPALEHYKNVPLVARLLEYQEVSKLLSTYVDGYLGTADKPSQIFGGRIYPSFVQYGTVTGRFSSRSPNVQNWPRPDTDFGKRIRNLFEPPPGHRLLVADYAQIELRILAHFAGKGRLWQGFWDGLDAHTATAAVVFGVAPEDVTKEMRQVAKGLAFAILYGAHEEKLAAMAKISNRRAKQFMTTHEREFPEIYAYKAKLLDTVRRRRPVPHLRTLLGRKRRLPDLLSRSGAIRSRAERQLVNSHIQGTNADLTKMAMVRFNRTRLPGMQLMLTVHDELAVLCPEEILDEGARILHEAMAGAEIQLLSVPVTTEVKICHHWSEAK